MAFANHQHLDERTAEKMPVHHRIRGYRAANLGYQAKVLPEPGGDLSSASRVVSGDAVDGNQGREVLWFSKANMHGSALGWRFCKYGCARLMVISAAGDVGGITPVGAGLPAKRPEQAKMKCPS
ncbi:hypothetical protein [Pseudomonas sp. MWU13-3659]|uniref:hypothetical protein n=1 Tax=Pseudomonas sp. MWU13-3659 TaxID=2986964 RepID=UPI0020756C13|nr:hypothetical protein [Pseudomonas sp. MWU13-3659]